MGCVNTPKIIQKDYVYDKMFFETHRIEFDIHLENIGDSGKIYSLVNNLIYKNKNFDEYREYKERNFLGNSSEADYPPRIDDDGTEHFYHSYLGEKYVIIFNNNAYIIIEYNLYFYNSGGAHGYPWINYFIIDIKEERILGIDDLIHPIPDDTLKEIIESNFSTDNSQRDNIWPPDTVNFCNENIRLLWNVYTITPYAIGIIWIDIQDKIIEPYLTDKGKMLKKLTTDKSHLTRQIWSPLWSARAR
jgi:hypothetical protein